LQQISNHYSVGVVLHQHAPGDCNHALRQSSGAVLSCGARQTALDFQLGGVRGKGETPPSPFQATCGQTMVSPANHCNRRSGSRLLADIYLLIRTHVFKPSRPVSSWDGDP